VAIFADVTVAVSPPTSLVLRVLLVIVALPLIPLGWHWTGHAARTCGPTENHTLDQIEVVMISAAGLACMCALVGRRFTIIAGGFITFAGWSCFVVGAGIAIGCLR
jgi:hypothetical protein